MSTIVKLVQGSPEWHEHRREVTATPAKPRWSSGSRRGPRRTSSGRSRPDVRRSRTSRRRWRTAPPLEPLAREAYEKLTGYVMQPLVLVEGEYSASLDGITLARDLVLEIKCPKSKDSKILSEAKAGRIPVDIYWQLQHQLLVSQADLAHLFVYDGGRWHPAGTEAGAAGVGHDPRRAGTRSCSS